MLPFSREQFVAVFADYNVMLGPVASAAPLIGLAIVVLLLQLSPRHDRIIGIGLAALWMWTGVAYHGLFFVRINQAAWLFGALFVLQGGLLLRATLQRRLRFAAPQGLAGAAGWALVGYAVVI